MTSLGIFSEEELELVSNIGYIISPSERLGEGLTVQVVDGLFAGDAQGFASGIEIESMTGLVLHFGQ